MQNDFHFDQYPLSLVLDRLLMDKTTGDHILWATDRYEKHGQIYDALFEILPQTLLDINRVKIGPKALGRLTDPGSRNELDSPKTIPLWAINRVLNLQDEVWFECADVFNTETVRSWISSADRMDFGKKRWDKYVERSILEPESEEAEFLVTRYDPETGDVLPVEKRVGALDRKLRVVCENTEREEDWIEWALYALESVYGYAFAGDAVMISRCLLLLSFADWYEAVWHKRASKRLLQDAAKKIAWNFWQMDPETGRVPYGHPESRIGSFPFLKMRFCQQARHPNAGFTMENPERPFCLKRWEKKWSKRKWDVVLNSRDLPKEENQNRL